MKIPQYTKGHPRSTLWKVTTTSTTSLWRWSRPLPTMPNTPETIEELTSSGYQLLPQVIFLAAGLDTQLSEIIVVEDSFTDDDEQLLQAKHEEGDTEAIHQWLSKRSEPQFWARTQDIKHAKRYPVVLTFSVDSNTEDTKTIEMLQFLPPPNMGEYGLISDDPIPEGDKAKTYHITQLSESAQEKQKKLNQALRQLAAPSAWIEHNPLTHPRCTSEQDYEQIVAHFQSQVSRGVTQQERETAQEVLIELNKAHEQIVALRQSWLKTDWLAQWEEIARMAKDLASDYYKYHQQLKKLPVATDIFPNGEALTTTCQPMQLFSFATQNAVSKDAAQWTYTKGHPPYFLKGSNILEYKNEESSIISVDESNKLWEQVKQQTDTQVDLAFAAISLCIRSTEPDHSAWIYAENFLKGRGKKKMTKPVAGENRLAVRRTAGYRQEDYQEVGHALFNLEKIWLTIDQPIDVEEYNRKTKKRKQRRYTYKGRLIIVKGALTQKDLQTTDSDTGMEVAWHIAPGDWLTPFLEMPNRQVAYLSEKALQYDPYRQKWEKYLSRYFFFNGHMNSKGRSCIFNRQVERLLQDCSLEIDRNEHKRTRDHFEKAMNQLVTDGFISRWYYKDHKNGYVPTRRIWLDEWLDLMITIEITAR